jgi:hypothetical protein
VGSHRSIASVSQTAPVATQLARLGYILDGIGKFYSLQGYELGQGTCGNIVERKEQKNKVLLLLKNFKLRN